MIHGELKGLKAKQRADLKKLDNQRVRADVIVSPEIAMRLAALTHATRRAIGLIIDRRGRITDVIIGDAERLYLPELGRQRGGGKRFRGVRLVRSIRPNAGLTRDDLTDLSKLQLDLVAAIEVDDAGRPRGVTWAHLVPDNPQRLLWTIEHAKSTLELEDDFSLFIAELEAEFEKKRDSNVTVGGDTAMLVYVRTRSDWNHKRRLAELHELCKTAGVEVVETYVQSRPKLDPKFATGKGALEEVELRCLQLGADVLVYGQDLTSNQVARITAMTQLRVIDRTQLILDIFAQRARTSSGKLQVELAQLKYALPRLSKRGTSMSRLMGGVGGRGPGETKLETDRRRVHKRIHLLEDGIKALRTQREESRKNRLKSEIPTIAIVGYTNAGKSTLLNTLTKSDVLSENKLFATLDPTSRRLRFPEQREVVLTDTVGFIEDLPTSLTEAFRATLDELRDADLLLHVVDLSNPGFEEHIRSTNTILKTLEVHETPTLMVFNKVDRLKPQDVSDLQLSFKGIYLSAKHRTHVTDLLDEIDRWSLDHHAKQAQA